MAMPLEGIRVVDWTIWQQGPVATMMLADLGAEVIKIEDRVQGDPSRGAMQLVGALTGLPSGVNFYFETLNRNKKSITIDLKKEAGREVVYRLVEKADVFVTNLRKGVPERLKLDYQTLKQFNRRLIYAVASGFGPKGPDSSLPTLDPTGLARSGLMFAVVPPGKPPQHVAGGVGDQIGAIMLSHTILAALLARERLGVGQAIDVSQLGSLMWLQAFNINASLMIGMEQPGWDREKAGNPIDNYYQCADGRWIFFALLQADRYWPDFCQALGILNLEKDPRFVDLSARQANCVELIGIIDKVMATKTSAEWLRILKDYPDFIYSAVNRASDLGADPQALANEYITDYELPDGSHTRMVGIPYSLSETPGRIRTCSPDFGQHTEEVLLDAGYTWDDIQRLRADGVI